MLAPLSISVFFLLLQHSATVPQRVSPNKLIVVSFDGFRYDYIHRNITPNIDKLVKKSTTAQVVLNVFPTQTFPNHFSIATGLYAENHGVLQSEVYDQASKKLLSYGYELWHYDESVLPIWILNEKLGGVSGVSMWPGSDFAYNGSKPTHYLHYSKDVSFNERVDTAVSWLQHKEKPANLAVMYFEEPDKDEHAYGPNSPQTDEQIKRVDALVKYLMDSLEKNGLMDTNVIFLSDHGMEGVMRKDIIDLQSFVGKNATMYGTSPALQVYPVEGQEEHVFKILDQKAKKLKTFKVYKKEDIPDRFHYKKCKRTPPILALAEPKYAFQDLYDGIQWYIDHYNVSKEGPFGVHGYDPNVIEMHPYFIATGPLFKENYKPNQIFTVDMFSLFARVLNLNISNVKHDGSLERIDSVLKSGASDLRNFGLALFGVSAVLVIVMVGAIAVFFIVKRRNSSQIDKTEYIKVDVEDDDEM